MPNLNVTYEQMNTAAQRLRTGQNELQSKLNELKTMIDGLVAEGYVTDKSSKAFYTAYGTFNDGATKTIAGLDGMATYLVKAAEALEQTDTELANAISK